MKRKCFSTLLFMFLLATIGCAQDSVVQNVMPPQQGQDDQEAEAMGHKRAGPPPLPPQFAIDACTGKAEGDVCQISTPSGDKSGVCFYMLSKKYFFCKPNTPPPPLNQKPG